MLFWNLDSILCYIFSPCVVSSLTSLLLNLTAGCRQSGCGELKQKPSSNLKNWTRSQLIGYLRVSLSAGIWSPPHTHTLSLSPARSLSLSKRTAASPLWSPNVFLFLILSPLRVREWTSLFNIFRPTSCWRWIVPCSLFYKIPRSPLTVEGIVTGLAEKARKKRILKSAGIFLTADGKLIGGKSPVWLSFRTETLLIILG